MYEVAIYEFSLVYVEYINRGNSGYGASEKMF